MRAPWHCTCTTSVCSVPTRGSHGTFQRCGIDGQLLLGFSSRPEDVVSGVTCHTVQPFQENVTADFRVQPCCYFWLILCRPASPCRQLLVCEASVLHSALSRGLCVKDLTFLDGQDPPACSGSSCVWGCVSQGEQVGGNVSLRGARDVPSAL